jgi:hypothetical protein
VLPIEASDHLNEKESPVAFYANSNPDSGR